MPRIDVDHYEVNLKEDFLDTINNLKRIEWRNQWTSFMINYFTTMGRISYFSGFGFLLTYIEPSKKIITLGLTHAYHSTMIFISNYFTSHYEFHAQSKMLKYCLSNLILMIIICFVQNYYPYLICVSLYILIQNFVDYKLSSIFETNDAKKASKALELLSSTTTPIVLGTYADEYKYKATRVFCLFSYTAAFIISIFVPKENED